MSPPPSPPGYVRLGDYAVPDNGFAVSVIFSEPSSFSFRLGRLGSRPEWAVRPHEKVLLQRAVRAMLSACGDGPEQGQCMASTATDSFGRRWRGAVFWDEERARLAARSTLLYMTVERCFVSAAEGERLWSNEDRANWLLCDGHVPHYIHRSSRSSLRDPRFDGGERDSEVAPPPMCRALTSRPNLALAGGGLYVRSRGDSGIFDLSPNPSWDAWEPASSEVQALLLRGCEAVRLSATRPEIGALLSNSVAVEVYWIGDVTPIEEGSEVKEDRETRRGVASQLYVVDASGLERLRLWRGAWSQQAAESWERSAGGGAGSFQRREPLTSS